MNIKGYLIAIALLTAYCPGPALAETDKCAACGACTACRKVCRLVCEETKIDVVCYGCKCEDFCISGPSCPKCDHCETVCGECNSEGVHSQSKEFRWTSWLPGHAKLYTRKKLMKKTVTKTIPTYRWVVEPVCASCWNTRCREAQAAQAENGTPPAGAIDAQLVAQTLTAEGGSEPAVH